MSDFSSIFYTTIAYFLEPQAFKWVFFSSFFTLTSIKFLKINISEKFWDLF